MEWLKIFSQPDNLAITCAIGLPIVIGGIIAITSIWMRHRERIAMIERGIHPDYPPEEDEQQDSSGGY